MQSSLVLQPEDLQEVLVLGHVWTDMGSWALIQKLISFFFLLVKRQQERVCRVWRSFDYSLWGLHVFFTWSWRWEGGGEVGEEAGKQVVSLHRPALSTLCKWALPFIWELWWGWACPIYRQQLLQNFKGGTQLSQRSEGTLRGKDGTQQLLAASSGPCQKRPIIPQCSKWPKTIVSIPEVQLSAKAGDPSGLYLTLYYNLTSS